MVPALLGEAPQENGTVVPGGPVMDAVSVKAAASAGLRRWEVRAAVK